MNEPIRVLHSQRVIHNRPHRAPHRQIIGIPIYPSRRPSNRTIQLHLRFDHIEGMGQKGGWDAGNDACEEVEQRDWDVVCVVERHNGRLDGVVEADVEAWVGCVAQNRRNEAGK